MHPRTQRNALAHLEDLFGNISEAVGLMAKSIRMRLQQHESCPCLCPYGLVKSFYACVKSRSYHDHGRCNHCSLTMYSNCLESLLKIQFLVLESVLITSFLTKKLRQDEVQGTFSHKVKMRQDSQIETSYVRHGVWLNLQFVGLAILKKEFSVLFP